ncbi:hypothetical protein Bbelb_062090 [Branchiostoma belcheri]|nr:hypothetical protein Bbelb_062090 [Branchiostoma belcheri]
MFHVALEGGDGFYHFCRLRLGGGGFRPRIWRSHLVIWNWDPLVNTCVIVITPDKSPMLPQWPRFALQLTRNLNATTELLMIHTYEACTASTRLKGSKVPRDL